MGFALDQSYTRAEIAEALGVSTDDHAVIVAAGQPLAIVVRKDGRHPSGKQYKNEIKGPVFVMHGEYEWRGELLEACSADLPVFFSDENDGRYRYAGLAKWSKTDDWDGEPFRYFVLDAA